MPPAEIIHIVNESRGNFEKAVGGTIKRITAASEVEPGKETTIALIIS